jgi:hypothetical protein
MPDRERRRPRRFSLSSDDRKNGERSPDSDSVVDHSPTSQISRAVPLLLLSGVALAAAWYLPIEKEGTALGRFSYGQLVTLIGIGILVITLSAYVVTPVTDRRRRAFQLVAVCLGLLGSIGLVESTSYLWPISDATSNPWYVDASPSEEGLPFRRPAGIRWNGYVPGDMTYGVDSTALRISFNTDENGFRNPRTPEQADVVFIGDSFTEGCSVNEEQCFARLVANELKLTSANLGRSAYSPGPELAVLRHYGIPLNPKTVVWQICEGNDLEDSVTWHYWSLGGSPPFFEEGERNRVTRHEAWKRRSPTWRFYSALREWPYEAVFADTSGSEIPIRFYRPLLPPYHSPLNHPGWKVTEESLTTGNALLLERQIRLLVVLVPLKLRVLSPFVEMSSEDQTELFESWTVPPDATWSRFLAQFCARNRIEFLDLSEPLRDAASKGVLVYLPNDTHLSPEGHLTVAQEISNTIRMTQ